ALVAYKRGHSHRAEINASAADVTIRIPWLVLHAALLPLLAYLSLLIYRDERTALPFAWLAGLWLLVALAAGGALFAAAAPARLWDRAARALGILWLYAAAAGVAAVAAISWSQALWTPTARITFALVAGLLHVVVPL